MRFEKTSNADWFGIENIPELAYDHNEILDTSIETLRDKITNITFTTHAEDKCLSVAVSSIISRYIFLKEMKKLSSELGINIPKGASVEVDKVGATIVNKYGINKLNEIAKINFKNTDKIKELL